MQSRKRWFRFRWSALVMSLLALAWTAYIVAFGEDDDPDDDDVDYDPLPGRSEEQIDALIFNLDEVFETIAIYASLMSVLIIILLLAIALRLKVWAAYVGLTILSMVWFALFEQVFTELYWLGIDIGYNALVITGFALASLHVVQAGLSINTHKTFGRARPLFFVLAIGIWGTLVVHLWVKDLSPAFIAVAALAMFGHIFAVPSFLASESATVKVDRNGVAFAIIVAIALLALTLFGEIDEDLDLVFLGRLVLLSVVTFFSVYLVRHAIVLLWERDTRIHRELEAARREAEHNRTLLEAEQKYSRARDAARRHTMRLATASHDIRQPIGALKSTVATFAKDQPKEVSDQLNAALDYLDQLAESYVDQEENDAEQGDALTRSDAKEIVASDMICATLDRMFRKEAEQKDLVFEASAEPSNLKTDPLAVMRILSNLLSNAIKHTPQGQITLRGERDESDYVFSVHNSTNLPEHIDKEKMFHPYEKGDHSTGSGLGLSIVDSLSSRAGMRLSWASPAGRGTTFDLIVPLE